MNVRKQPSVFETEVNQLRSLLPAEGVGVANGTVYHAFPGRRSFGQTDFLDSSIAGTGNDFFGTGLYVGQKDLAEKYHRSYGRQGKPGGVEALEVTNAVMLDLEALGHLHPSDAFVDSFREFVLSKLPQLERTNQVEELQHAERLFHKIKYIDFMHLCRRAPAIVKDYFQFIGVDGVKGTIQPSVDPGTNHKIAVFWNSENIQSKERAQIRADQNERVTAVLGSIAVGVVGSRPAADIYENIEPSILPEQGALQQDFNLSAARASLVLKNFTDRQFTFNVHQTERFLAEISNPAKPAFDMVRLFAGLSPGIDCLYSANTGVWEQYALHEHTQAVLNRFHDEYLRHGLSDTESMQNATGIMNLVFLLQDIGKPLAYALEGHTGNHQEYNSVVSDAILSKLPIQPKVKSLVQDLATQNFYGEVMTGESVKEKAVDMADFLEKHVGVISGKGRLSKLKDLLIACHKSDAGAYTAKGHYYDSRGKLKHCLPVFDQPHRDIFKRSTITRRIAYTKRSLKKIVELDNEVAKILKHRMQSK